MTSRPRTSNRTARRSDSSGRKRLFVELALGPGPLDTSDRLFLMDAEFGEVYGLSAWFGTRTSHVHNPTTRPPSIRLLELNTMATNSVWAVAANGTPTRSAGLAVAKDAPMLGCKIKAVVVAGPRWRLNHGACSRSPGTEAGEPVLQAMQKSARHRHDRPRRQPQCHLMKLW